MNFTERELWEIEDKLESALNSRATARYIVECVRERDEMEDALDEMYSEIRDIKDSLRRIDFAKVEIPSRPRESTVFR